MADLDFGSSRPVGEPGNEGEGAQGQFYDLLERAHAAFVGYARLTALYRDIKRCWQTSKIAKSPHCMSLEGQSGAGKTTLVRRFVLEFQRRETDEGTEVPILYVLCQSPVTEKGLVSLLLEKLGDPAPDRGVQHVLDRRLVKLLKACKVELVILDDIHNLLYADTRHRKVAVSNWLKSVIKASNVPFLAVSIENKIEEVLESNEELSRLFGIRETLYPFAWDTDNAESLAEFAKFMQHAIKAIGMGVRTTLETADILYRLHHATGGVVSNIMTLLLGAQQFALERGSSGIELTDLSAAFAKHLAKHMRGRMNAFAAGADGLVPVTFLQGHATQDATPEDKSALPAPGSAPDRQGEGRKQPPPSPSSVLKAS
jgi:hypothetical protein